MRPLRCEEMEGMTMQDRRSGGGEKEGSCGNGSETKNSSLRMMLVDVGQERKEVDAGGAEDDGEGDGEEDADKGDKGGEGGELPCVEQSPAGEAAS